MGRKVLLGLLVLLGLISWAQGKTRVRMVLIPFETEAAQEFSKLRDGLMDMLSSRLERERAIELLEKGRLTREVIEVLKKELAGGATIELAKEFDLDYIIYGTLRKIGDSIALDARLVRVKEAKKRLSFFVEAETLQALVPRLDELAEAISSYALKEEGIAPAPPLPAPRVTRVGVEGNRRVSTERIMSLVKTRPGARFSQPRLQEDLSSIKGLKEVADVKAVITQTARGVEVTFSVQEGKVPLVRISKLVFIGNQRVKKETLLTAIKSRVGAPFSDEVLAKDLGALRELTQLERVNVDLLDTEKGKEVFFVLKERETPLAKEGKKKEPLIIVPPEKRIKKITVSGNRVIDSAAIRAALKSKVGDPFSSDKIRDDIKAIFKMGYFEDVQVNMEQTRTGRDITYQVREKPVIAKIELLGNKKVSNSDLMNALDFGARDVLNLIKVKDGVRRLLEVYEEKGFYAAQIDHQVEHLPSRQVRVVYQVQENEKVFIKKISFRGNKVFGARELKKVVTTKKRGFLSFVTGSGVLNREKLKTDRELLVDHYGNHGYIKAIAGEPEVKIEKKGIFITFPIDEGKQFKVGDVDLEGDLIVQEKELRKRLRLIPGQTFGRDLLRGDIRRLTEFYTNRGFAFANVSPKTTLDQAARTVSVVFNIEKSRKVFIDKINVTGNRVTHDKVIRRQMTISEGDRFSGSALAYSRRRIESLGYFRKVEVASREGGTAQLLNIDVRVAEGPTGSFGVGAGASTQEGPSVFGEIRQNNFLGRGIRLSGRAQLGGAATRFEVSHFDPSFLDSRFSLSTQAFNTFQDFRDFDRDSLGGLFRFGYPLSPLWRVWLGYRLELVKLTDLADDAADVIRQEEGKSTISAAYWELSRDTRDFLFDPTEGSLYKFSTEVAGGFLGGDSDFAKFTIDGRKYLPFRLFNRTAVVMLRGLFGYIEPFGDKDVRIFERFFLGGIGRVRGYESNSIGPRDKVTDNVLGGTKQVVLTAELAYPLWDRFKVKGILFFDAGNSFDGSDTTNPKTLRKSVGFGVRFMTPLGPIRLEYGVALDRLPGDDMGKLEFRIGG
ncbi:MAG: outer membrane protein assembly factor BamA [Thermodesulfobacteriota bacterium]